MRIEDEINPLEIDWEYIWQKSLKKGMKKEKDWNSVAKDFGKWLENDDYPDILLKEMKISSEDTVLDIGCGEGTITKKIAKKAKSVTGIDKSEGMLEILNEKAQENNITNIETIEEDLTKITADNVGKHDIVVASRSLNNIINIKETIANINEIANKYVYITLFGPNNWKLEKEFYQSINKEYAEFPSHRYFFNILVDMGIYPNVENLNIGHEREYETIEEALESGKWRLDNLDEKEKEQLYEFLETILHKNENGKLSNPEDKADWVLYWWKK